MIAITLQGVTVEGDTAIVYYGRAVGENSIARCSMDIPMSEYLKFSGNDLIKFIKKEIE